MMTVSHGEILSIWENVSVSYIKLKLAIIRQSDYIGTFTSTFATHECYLPVLGVHVYMSLVLRKPVFGVSDQVRHKPGCTALEDGWRLEIPDLESRGIVLSV